MSVLEDPSIFKLLGLVFLMFSFSGCSSIYYLYQAGRGQLKLLNRGKAIEDVVQDPRTEPELIELLKKIPEIKAYGEKSGLKATSNYREYVKLDDDAVVYVVTVSDTLAFKPKIFSFPIVGSFNYIGWFGREDAKKFASTFEKDGYDVDVRGAGAYSTLGWFRDPLLSSMIPKDQGKIVPEAFPELVNVFLHESVHATVYISNQSYFNEGLAMFVAGVLTDRFFRDHGLLQSDAYLRYQKYEARSEMIRKKFTQAYQDLKNIYDSAQTPEQKLKAKNEYLSKLQTDLGFRRKITNATLIQFQTYHSSEPEFRALFQQAKEDVQVLFKVLSTLSEKDFEHPQSEDLKSLMIKLKSRI
ncbi:MAG: aminopeptidase [Bdellovibrionales bacterium]|nr:aminopeptidase [Oligoflexia bacterium]